MAKVCLFCGTPKLGRRCRACRAVTLTHEGEAREPICLRCTRVNPDGSCGWSFRASNASQDRLVVQFARSTIDSGFRKAALYTYQCPDDQFRQNPYARTTPSPNPLSPQQVERIKLFREVPTAFWLDPRYDDRDARRPDYWTLPVTLKGVLGLAAIGLASAAIAVAAPKRN